MAPEQIIALVNDATDPDDSDLVEQITGHVEEAGQTPRKGWTPSVKHPDAVWGQLLDEDGNPIMEVHCVSWWLLGLQAGSWRLPHRLPRRLLVPQGGSVPPHEPEAPARGRPFPSLALRARVAPDFGPPVLEGFCSRYCCVLFRCEDCQTGLANGAGPFTHCPTCGGENISQKKLSGNEVDGWDPHRVYTPEPKRGESWKPEKAPGRRPTGDFRIIGPGDSDNA
jgi:hypothetical protein